MDDRNMKNECWDCKHMREVPGNAHISCVNPDANMEGHPYGMKNGWFEYSQLFDPVWKMKDCSNFKAKS